MRMYKDRYMVQKEFLIDLLASRQNLSLNRILAIMASRDCPLVIACQFIKDIRGSDPELEERLKGFMDFYEVDEVV